MASRIIGITGINAIDNPGPGVGVARSLKEATDLDATIVGLAYDAMEPGIYMDWLIDKAYVMPYPSGHPGAYLKRLEDIKRRHGLDMLIPTLDAELPLLVKCRRQLEDLGIRTCLPTAEQLRLRSKEHLKDVADRIGLICPKTETVTSYEDLSRAIDNIGLPVMIKGAYYKAYLAKTKAEAQGNYSSIVAEWGYPIIVQEVVSGQEMNVVAVGDGLGSCLGMVGIKKLVTTALGKIWNGVTIKNEAMLEATRTFIQHYRWAGGMELECITDGENVYLIEINPRFPAWTYFATGVGVNLPANMVRHVYRLAGDTHSDYEAGKLLIRYTYEKIIGMTMFQKMTIHGEN